MLWDKCPMVATVHAQLAYFFATDRPPFEPPYCLLA